VPLAHRILLSLAILGAYSQIVQAMLIRESLAVFYGNEASLGVFYGGWLFWLAAGSAAALALRRRAWVREPLPALAAALLALPPLLLVEVLGLRTVRLVLDVSASELVPLGELFVSIWLICLPSGLALGIAFPLACRALALAGGEAVPAGGPGAVAPVSRLYVADALGALAGGALFTLVLVPHLKLVETLGVLALALGLAALSLARGRRPLVWGALLLAAAGLLLALGPATPSLGLALERLRFAVLQPGLKLLDSAETRYGHVAVASLGEGPGRQVSVAVDGQILESFPLPDEVRTEAAYFQAQSSGARRILLFGGLAGGLPAELLRWPVERVEVVEDDAQGFELVRPFLDPRTELALADPRLHLTFADGRRFLADLPAEARYDLVLVLYAAPTSAFGNRYFTRDFYEGLRPHLGETGVVCTQVSGASHYLGHTVGSYNASVYRTMAAVFPHIAIAPGERQVFCGSQSPGPTEDPALLERRYLAQPIAEHDLPGRAFANLLPAEEIAYVRGRLAESRSDLNTDRRPVTYYLNMILWGKLSASALVDWMERLRLMGPWPYLLPPLLLVGLWTLRAGLGGFERPAMERQGAVFALGVLGLVSMAAQLVLLFAYQAQVGFMFERIALLNGVFMTGLALGAGLGAAWERRGGASGALTLVLLATAAAMLALPWLLDSLWRDGSVLGESGYFALSWALGLLTGAGFPIGAAIAHRSRPQIVATGGAAAAADNLGGALGGLVAGTLLVPLLGTDGTVQVLAILAPLALVPLLFARLAPAGLARPRPRGVPSFPWTGMGRALTFSVLLVYGWHLLEGGTAPGPQVRFDEGRLHELAGGLRFEPRDQPFVHYLGWPGDRQAQSATAGGTGPNGGPDAVALATMAAAPEVRGFGGPLNLLLAVDRDGTLLGARHLDSNETRSYIAGIDEWLGALAGTDLRVGALAGRVDGLSGATVTSRAALDALDRAAAQATGVAFGNPVPTLAGPTGPRLGAGFWATLALLVAFFPVYFRGGEGARLALMAASVLVLGLWLNTPITEQDLGNLSLGQAAGPAENPQRWLILGFAGLSAILLGPVWCGYLCPFGALQGLVSRLGRRLGLRAYPDRRLDWRVRQLKYLLLGLMLMALWSTGDPTWVAFDPMQQVFGGRLTGWMLVLALIALLGSLVYVRFWCRYLCPVGAFLALGNRLALLDRLAPRRRFERCDLGVRHAYDLDCCRCGRCFAGNDTGMRRDQGAPAGGRDSRTGD
jgi:spermidine synthase